MPFEPPGKLPPEESRRPFPQTWEEYLEAAKLWLEQHWGEARCAQCGHQTWRINEVVNLVSATDWPIAQGSQYGYYPGIPVVCSTCGYIALVNAGYIFRTRA
jgi:hypothetical protein